MQDPLWDKIVDGATYRDVLNGNRSCACILGQPLYDECVLFFRSRIQDQMAVGATKLVLDGSTLHRYPKSFFPRLWDFPRDDWHGVLFMVAKEVLRNAEAHGWTCGMEFYNGRLVCSLTPRPASIDVESEDEEDVDTLKFASSLDFLAFDMLEPKHRTTLIRCVQGVGIRLRKELPEGGRDWSAFYDALDAVDCLLSTADALVPLNPSNPLVDKDDWSTYVYPVLMLAQVTWTRLLVVSSTFTSGEWDDLVNRMPKDAPELVAFAKAWRVLARDKDGIWSRMDRIHASYNALAPCTHPADTMSFRDKRGSAFLTTERALRRIPGMGEDSDYCLYLYARAASESFVYMDNNQLESRDTWSRMAALGEYLTAQFARHLRIERSAVEEAYQKVRERGLHERVVTFFDELLATGAATEKKEEDDEINDVAVPSISDEVHRDCDDDDKDIMSASTLAIGRGDMVVDDDGDDDDDSSEEETPATTGPKPGHEWFFTKPQDLSLETRAKIVSFSVDRLLNGCLVDGNQAEWIGKASLMGDLLIVVEGIRPLLENNLLSQQEIAEAVTPFLALVTLTWFSFLEQSALLTEYQWHKLEMMMSESLDGDALVYDLKAVTQYKDDMRALAKRSLDEYIVHPPCGRVKEYSYRQFHRAKLLRAKQSLTPLQDQDEYRPLFLFARAAACSFALNTDNVFRNGRHHVDSLSSLLLKRFGKAFCPLREAVLRDCPDVLQEPHASLLGYYDTIRLRFSEPQKTMYAMTASRGDMVNDDDGDDESDDTSFSDLPDLVDVNEDDTYSSVIIHDDNDDDDDASRVIRARYHHDKKAHCTKMIGNMCVVLNEMCEKDDGDLDLFVDNSVGRDTDGDLKDAVWSFLEIFLMTEAALGPEILLPTLREMDNYLGLPQSHAMLRAMSNHGVIGMRSLYTDREEYYQLFEDRFLTRLKVNVLMLSEKLRGVGVVLGTSFKVDLHKGEDGELVDCTRTLVRTNFFAGEME